MVTHTLNTCSAFYTSKVHKHSSEQTLLEQWAAIYAAAPGEQLGVWCLAQRHLSHGIEGGKRAVHSLPPPTIPAGPRLELATFGLSVQLSNHYATTSQLGYSYSFWHYFPPPLNLIQYCNLIS